jgi:hypothetical protein
VVFAANPRITSFGIARLCSTRQAEWVAESDVPVIRDRASSRRVIDKAMVTGR